MEAGRSSRNIYTTTLRAGKQAGTGKTKQGEATKQENIWKGQKDREKERKRRDRERQETERQRDKTEKRGQREQVSKGWKKDARTETERKRGKTRIS